MKLYLVSIHLDYQQTLPNSLMKSSSLEWQWSEISESTQNRELQQKNKLDKS
jgi:hypothetical protein